MSSTRRMSYCASAVVAGVVACALLTQPVRAAGDGADSRPYDDKLMRLSILLGAIHYLRELCGSNDGQLWRDRMVELIDTDKGSALRRVRLTKGFNYGYRSYRRTHPRCDNAAKVTMRRFLNEGAQLSELLVREAP